MSIRAYKLIEIKTAPDPTFNCWSDQEIMELAEENDQYNDGGILTFHDEEVMEAWDKLNKKTDRTEDEMETMKKLQQILNEMDGENYIDYYCY